MAKKADYFRRLPYTRRARIETDEAGKAFFVAFIEELPGVEAVGDTEVEARAGLTSAFLDYIDAMLEWGDAIPEPKTWPQAFGWEGGDDTQVGAIELASLVGIDVGAQATAVSDSVGGVHHAKFELAAA